MRQVRKIGVVLALLLFASVGHAQEAAYYDQGGVEYYMVVGEVGTGTVTYGTDSPQILPFDGCVVAKLRPGTTNGRVRIIGAMDGVRMEFDMNRFSDPGVVENIQVDGQGPSGSQPHPDVHATIAAQGRSTMEGANLYYNDPVTGDPFLSGLFFVTDQGFRDDASGVITEPAADPKHADWEAHFRVASAYNGTVSPATEEVEEPPQEGLVPAFLPPAQEYAAHYDFSNVRFGGQGLLEVEASSIATGGNDLVFLLRSPNGSVIHESVATPSVGQDFQDSVTVPLDRFGAYTVEVRGAVNMAQYRIQFTQTPASTFALDFWWEELTAGVHAPAAQRECEAALFGEQAPSGYVSDLPPPPPWPWHQVVLTILGAIATSLVMVKVTMMAHAAAKHRSIAKNR